MSLAFRLSDRIPEPSVSTEDLNNELTKMRSAVKTAKVFVLRDLIRYIRKLRLKTSHSKNCNKLERKLQSRLSDVNILRHLSVNRLCKRLLANESNEEILHKNGHKITQEDRLIVRLGTTKPVNDFITLFRSNHEDWRSLVHYLLYKNVSGKWKSREQKRRGRKVHGSLPLPPVNDLVSQEALNDVEMDPNPVCYRIDTNVQTEEKSPELVENTINSDDNPDSDAASDIADEIINKIITNKSTCTKFVTSSESDQSSNKKFIFKLDKSNSKTDRNLTAVKEKNEVVTIESKSKVKPVIKSPINKEFLVQHLPNISNEEDDNPLGSDHLEMKKRLKHGDNYRNRKIQNPDTDRSAIIQRPFHKANNLNPVKNSLKPNSNKKVPKEISKPGIHPSWAAKLEQKSKIKHLSNGPLPEVKRIVFDDKDEI